MESDLRGMLTAVRLVLVQLENGETAIGGGPSPSIGPAIDTLDRALAITAAKKKKKRESDGSTEGHAGEDDGGTA